MNGKLVYGVRVAYLVTAWLFVAGILFQVYLVGRVLLARQQDTWEAHIGFGHVIGVLPLLMIILSFAGRLPSPFKGLTGLLFAVYFIQAEVFAGIRDTLPQAAAFHPVLALVVFSLAVLLAQQAWGLVRRPVQPATA